MTQGEQGSLLSFAIGCTINGMHLVEWHATGGTGRQWDSQALASHSRLTCLHSEALGALTNSCKNRVGRVLFIAKKQIT